VVTTLEKCVHLLIAGATGSGKSVCINSIITSILFKARPDQVKLLLIDPKRVELSAWSQIPHLIAPVVTDPKKASSALRWAIKEMESRYEQFTKVGTRDVDRYNEIATPPGSVKPALPYIVIIIDELSDLMMVAPAEVEDSVFRLAQMARAAGIHLVVATQRPSVDVITGTIKANIPSRIAFAVSSQTDSRTILDMGGAEKLLGRGDMLFFPVGAVKPLRAQGSYISEREIDEIVSFIASQAKPQYVQGVLSVSESATQAPQVQDDPLFAQALRIVVEAKQASVSLLQRRLPIGYSRAARLIDAMELKGYIGPYEGSKPREVKLTMGEYLRLFESQGQTDDIRPEPENGSGQAPGAYRR
jgi:S-DNA-T family DNA segregation ATPase FtsK/SpoIIIE